MNRYLVAFAFVALLVAAMLFVEAARPAPLMESRPGSPDLRR
jgi:hypothetical protein